jgi:hypothetical protein
MKLGMIETGKLVSANVNVTTAGTAVQAVAGGLSLTWGCLCKALNGNTGMVYVGNVAGDITALNSIELDQNEQVFIACSDLSDLWFDAATNGDDIRILYG